MPADAVVNKNEIIELKGITNDIVETFGTVSLALKLTNYTIYHKFNIVPQDFPIPTNGLIGKDFLQCYSCILDYGTNAFTIRTKFGETKLDMNRSANQIFLPPRCEVYRIFKIEQIKSFPAVIKSKQIADGVWCATSIIHDDTPAIRIVNTTDEIVSIKNIKLQSEAIDKYNILKMKEEKSENERTEKLLNILKTKAPIHMQTELLSLCKDFADVFAMENDTATKNNFYTQTLNVTDHTPVFTKNYRMPHSQKNEIAKQVNKLLKNDLIEPSQSPYSSPIILVPKKSNNTEKAWRLCIDYRKVNKQLVADKFPLPRIDDVLESLGKARYFSVIDLFNGFHQVPLDEKSRDITSFSTDDGSFRWKVLPFGLNISPNSFSRMMKIAFSGLPPERAFLYIDDIIVIGRTEKHHLYNLRSVFEILRKFNLKINPNKCKFFQNEVIFLGHECSASGISPDEQKLEAVKKYLPPHDKDAVRRFVAFCNYYRKFIPNFAKIAIPLTKLTRKKTPFIWTEIEQNAFEKLKSELSKPRILQYPDFTREFIITTDASKYACGAVLSQSVNGEDLPVSFFSKSFQKGECNKPPIEQELLAIYHAINAFKPYVYGYKFLVRTDHKPLIYLYQLKKPTTKLIRIRLELDEYNFDIEHIAGKSNVVADALSRVTLSDIKKMNEISKDILAITRSMSKNKDNAQETEKAQNNSKSNNTKTYSPLIESNLKYNTKKLRMQTMLLDNKSVTSAQISIYKSKNKICELNWTYDKNETDFPRNLMFELERASTRHNFDQIQWPLEDKFFEICRIENFKKACMKVLKNVTVILVKKPKFVANEIERNELINKFHTCEINGGHVGKKKLCAKLRSEFYWRGLTRDVAKYVNNCKSCMLNKPKRKTFEKLKITATPQKPFDVVILDTVGPLKKTDLGNQYAVTLICDLTKFLITIAVPNKEANTIARAIVENCILIFGQIKSIRTDRGTEYKNSIIKELCELLNISHDFSTPYHHESLGTIERNHRVLNEFLRAYLKDNNWDFHLKYFTHCYNISFNASMNHQFTPFELVFCKRNNFPHNLSEKIDPIYNFENYAKIAKYSLQTAHAEAAKLVNKTKIINKKILESKSNPIDVSINDSILIKKEPYKKLESIYDGPFKIKEIIDKNVMVNINGKDITVHKNRIVKV